MRPLLTITLALLATAGAASGAERIVFYEHFTAAW